MSVLTEKEIAIKIRRRMGWAVAERLRVHPLIDDALLLLSRDAAKDANRRKLFLTDRDTTTVALDVDGVADLTALIASPRIIIDCLHYGEIYDPSSVNPLVERQQGTRQGNYDDIYLHYVLDGVKIRTQSADNNVTPLDGPLSLAVVKWVTLAGLAEQEVERLVEKGVQLLAESYRQYQTEANDE